MKNRVTTSVADEVLIPVTGEGDDPEEELETLEGEEVEEAEDSTQINDGADDDNIPDVVGELKAQVEKLTKDINKQKSVYQKNENDYKQREQQLKARLDELLKKGMTEDEAKLYERDQALTKVEELQAQLAQVQQERQQEQMRNYWKSQFLDEYGIDRNELNLDGGVEELVASGMDALKKMLKSAKQTESKPVIKAKPKTEPPKTPKPIGGADSGKLTLKELAEKYSNGDVDKLYDMWGTGQLDRSLFTQVAETYEEE